MISCKQNHHKIIKRTTKKGSFLADVLVSIVILTMGMATSYTVVSQAIVSNSVNKNKIIAINLAREAMEAIELVRGTNWLRYGTKKRVCWNFWSNTNEDAQWNESGDSTCEESNTHPGQNQHPIGFADIENDGIGDVKIKSYLAVLDTTNYDWTLVENFEVITDQQLSFEKTCDATNILGSFTTALTSGDDCSAGDTTKWQNRRDKVGTMTSRLYADSSSGLYTHDASVGNTETNFYREIFIDYPFGTNGFFPESESFDNQILITVIVWYRGHGGFYRKVVLETELTDYLERSSWVD